MLKHKNSDKSKQKDIILSFLHADNNKSNCLYKVTVSKRFVLLGCHSGKG